MFRVKESIHVNAPVERCFLLATSVPLVQQILGMKPVEGPEAFASVNVFLGAVTWSNGIDLAPDAMYEALRIGGVWVLE